MKRKFSFANLTLNFYQGEAYSRLNDHHNALSLFKTRLDIIKKNKKKYGSLATIEIMMQTYYLAKEVEAVGKYEESLNLYQDVYG